MPKFLIAALIGWSTVICFSAPTSPADRETSPEASKRNFGAVWKYLKPAIFNSDRAVLLYYRAVCHATNDFFDQEPVPFPFTKVQSPTDGKTGLAAIHEIFKNDDKVTVKEDSEGVIRIWIGDVPTAILKTRLNLVTFEQTDQYNPDDALGSILQSKEMKAAMRSLHFGIPAGVGAGNVVEPMKGLPHLPTSIKGGSLGQALDKIAKTWAGEGIVVYGACNQSTESNGDQLFRIDYAGDLLPR